MVTARINQSPASPRLFEHAWTWAAGDVIGWSSYFRVCTSEEGKRRLWIKRSGAAVTTEGGRRVCSWVWSWVWTVGKERRNECGTNLLFFFFCSLFWKSRHDLAHVEKCMLNSHFLCIIVSGKSVHVHYITKEGFCSCFGENWFTPIWFGNNHCCDIYRKAFKDRYISWDIVAAPHCWRRFKESSWAFIWSVKFKNISLFMYECGLI